MTDEILWDTKKALERITTMKKITSLKIATAFIEFAGVDWIEILVGSHKIAKENINIYLSASFSQKNPSAILERLSSFAEVYILFFPKLHAKAVFAQSDEKNGKLVLGSANLTFSGINRNIELSNVIDITEQSNIKYFFEKCMGLGKLEERSFEKRGKRYRP